MGAPGSDYSVKWDGSIEATFVKLRRDAFELGYLHLHLKTSTIDLVERDGPCVLTIENIACCRCHKLGGPDSRSLLDRSPNRN
jgi:hypothetical protein